MAFSAEPPAKTGTALYSRLNGWLGRPLSELGIRQDQARCHGAFAPVLPAPVINVQPDLPAAARPGGAGHWWRASGTVWSTGDTVVHPLIALVDRDERVLAYAVSGFKYPLAETPRAGWGGYFQAEPGTVLRAFVVLDDGAVLCRIPGAHGFPLRTEQLTSGSFSGAVAMSSGGSLLQRFKPAARLEGLSVRVVTFGHRVADYPIRWAVRAAVAGTSRTLGTGTLQTRDFRDWALIPLPLSEFPEDPPDEIVVTLTTDGVAQTEEAAGFPLYRPSEPNAMPAEVQGKSSAEGGQLGLSLDYDQSAPGERDVRTAP